MKTEPQGFAASVEGWLWRADAPVGTLRAMIQYVLRMLHAVGRDVAAGQLTLRAMSLVYTTLLSLVPLLAISFSVLKGFGVHNQIEPFLQRLLEPLGERSQELTAQVIAFVDNMQVGVLGLVGLVMLFYTVLSLMQKIEAAFNDVWQVARTRSLAERFRDYLSVIVVGPVLVFTTLGLVASLFASSIVQDLRILGPVGLALDLVGNLLPLALLVLAFTGIYVLVPNTSVRWGPAMLGGLVAGVLWTLLGQGFAIFIASAGTYAAVYSGFATPILFMIWLYLGWLVLLIGASFAFYRQHPHYLRGRHTAADFSIAERETIALYALAAIGRRFYAGSPPPGAEPLGHDLGVPTEMVEQVLGELVHAGIVVQADDAEGGFLPAKPWEIATLAEAYRAIRGARPGAGRATAVGIRIEGPDRAPVMALLDLLEREADAALGVTKLKEFVMAGAPDSKAAVAEPAIAEPSLVAKN